LPGSEIKSETRVDPAPQVGIPGLSGTVDVQIIQGSEFVEIIDYKDGMNETDAREQLEQYAFGVVHPAIKSIRLTVIQPKLRLVGKT
jgi:beta-lactam-binding protein with PASTA domain